MLQIETPYSKDEIVSAIRVETEAVRAFFGEIDRHDFFAHPPDVWSPADNLVHLIKSVSPVITALGVPKMALRMRFGKSKRPSTTLPEVIVTYQQALANGGAAGGGFLPEVAEETEVGRQKILAKWLEKSKQLIEKLAGWDDADLDQYQLPHPLIGNMTVREILFFTLYHNMHHVKDVQRLLNMPEANWFVL